MSGTVSVQCGCVSVFVKSFVDLTNVTCDVQIYYVKSFFRWTQYVFLRVFLSNVFCENSGRIDLFS